MKKIFKHNQKRNNPTNVDCLISFVGTNDAGKMFGEKDGAILTIFLERKFDEVHLLWNPSNNSQNDFQKIAEYVKKEIIQRKYCSSVYLHEFPCTSVTDHNQIYPALLNFCRTFLPLRNNKYTAAIASGTPAMQVCWILIAESSDFPLKLIRSNEPKFGKPFVSDIKLGTGLPRIVRLEKENKSLNKNIDELLDDIIINYSKGTVYIGKIKIDFAPIEFAYYSFFAQQKKEGKELLRISGITIPPNVLENIYAQYVRAFPDLDINLKKNIGVTTVRGNISKVNTKIKKALRKTKVERFYMISIEGKRNAKLYGIILERHKIIIYN